jgi:transcriptional regulator with XRE-family HTH domain
MELDKVIGRQVRQARKLLLVKQTDLARRLAERDVHMHQATITRLERGDRSLSVADLFAVTVELGVSPLWLLSGSYTNEAVPVLPEPFDPVSPPRMRAWLRGQNELPGADPATFFGVVPDDEHRARLHRGVQNMQRSLSDYLDAVAAKDQRGMADAIGDLHREVERQEADLQREERLARKEKDNG